MLLDGGQFGPPDQNTAQNWEVSLESFRAPYFQDLESKVLVRAPPGGNPQILDTVKNPCCTFVPLHNWQWWWEGRGAKCSCYT